MFYTPRFLLHIPVFKRLVPSVLKRYAKWFKQRFIVEKRYGIRMLLDQRNSVDRNLLLKGVWEPEQLERLTAASQSLSTRQWETRVFLDIGAHWGLYSILMHRTGCFDRIIAFEPEATNLAQLMGNLFVNELVGKIEVRNVALSDRDGVLSMEPGPTSNRGGARVALDSREQAVGREVVPCCRLDALLQLQNAMVVIKIDVEGHELAVLQGMQRLLQQNCCFVQIESFGEQAVERVQRALGGGYHWVGTVGDDHYYSNCESLDQVRKK